MENFFNHWVALWMKLKIYRGSSSRPLGDEGDACY